MQAEEQSDVPDGPLPSATRGDHDSAPRAHADGGPHWSSGAPVIDGYAIERQIGRGGSATVFLARELKHDRQVAVKVLHPALVASIQAERFLREISIIAKLAHPNILPLLDSGRTGDVLYYVSPYVPGESLRKRLERERRLDTGEAVRLTREVAEALDYAHRAGLVHRDVKPENILLADGHALVADFGIARALSLATDDRLTTAGLALGTPRYMSPEQASGGFDVDGRADVYSLGCVLFELLAGQPPFSGSTPQEVMAQHAGATVPQLRDLSPGIPAQIEVALRTALAKRPADRYASPRAFIAGLDGSSVTHASWGIRLPPAFRSFSPATMRIAGAAVVAMLLGVWFLDRARQSDLIAAPSPDTSRVAVFAAGPLAVGLGWPTGDELLHEAISQWEGITLVDQFQVRDGLARSGGAVTVAGAARLAASLGAGRYILVQVSPAGDSARVYATVYEAPAARQLATATATVSASPDGAAWASNRVAQQLLLRGAVDTSATAFPGSRTLPAVQAFSAAQGALARWDLPAADSAFQAALAFDSRYARASYWLAQVRAWTGLRADDWLSLAERAAESAAGMSERERLLATALVELGRNQFQAACRTYSELRDRNDRDFAAWYGLGQCRSRDRVAVPDSSSPSGWRMRSSYYAAVRSYDRALGLLPSAYAGYEHDAFEGLRALLMAGTRLIPARGAGADSAQLQARLGKLGDTLALIPYPWRDAFAGGGFPPGHEAAIRSRLVEFRRLAGVWSAAFPRRAGPKHAVSVALEAMGDPRAVDTLILARSLTQDPVRRTEFAATETLLRVKFSDYSALRDVRTVALLADSLLVAPLQAATASLVAPIAALSGNCQQAESASRLKRVEPTFPVSEAVGSAVDLHLARAAIGCGPGATGVSLAALSARVEREGASLRGDARRLLDLISLYRPALLAEAVDSALVRRLASQNPDPLLMAASLIAVNDTARARSEMGRFSRPQHPALGPPSPDLSWPAARLWLALHDTAAAVSQLDATLNGIRNYDSGRLRDPVIVASMLRSMVLRADIASAAGDSESARRWGRVVAELWSGADAGLQPVVRRMARYAAAKGSP